MRQIQEERLALGLLDHLDRFGGVAPGDFGQDVQNVGFDLLFVPVQRAGPHVVAVGHTEVAVKAKLVRMKLWLLTEVAQMPLANHGRAVACYLERGGDGQFLVGQAFGGVGLVQVGAAKNGELPGPIAQHALRGGLVGRVGVARHAGAKRIAPREQAGARRRADTAARVVVA